MQTTIRTLVSMSTLEHSSRMPLVATTVDSKLALRQLERRTCDHTKHVVKTVPCVLLSVAILALVPADAFVGPVCRRALLAVAGFSIANRPEPAPADMFGPPMRADSPTRPGATMKAWEGRWNDAEHKGCKREITVTSEGLLVDGKDGEPNCLTGPVTAVWKLPATWKEGSDTLVIDFSPRGGSKDVPAKFIPGGVTFAGGVIPTPDPQGGMYGALLFPDGSKWIRAYPFS
eukprot:TRINITY_DN107454_c0_g1_i1.p1 TRINITY_DN107454_c0_g1~~TRINITY_DN107454_c0_g1_i1.p1  ORF type:complete len:231 (+),score=19.13 TRINITY_DN107454_c0_g1_i1:1-693(+)